MKPLTPIALSILLAASVVSCSRDNRAETNESRAAAAPSARAARAPTAISSVDMAEGNRAEIELEQAGRRARNESTGERLCADVGPGPHQGSG